jgi:Cu(I)/Ag(I) efflux system membrane protein CusA/SilA
LQNLLLRRIWPDRISWEDLIAEMDQKVRIPGVTNSWTMPIKARIDMLTTGVRTPIGIKVFGADLAEIQKIGGQLETLLAQLPEPSVFATRGGGYFVTDLKRDQLARYGLSVADAQNVVASASAVKMSPPPSRAVRVIL